MLAITIWHFQKNAITPSFVRSLKNDKGVNIYADHKQFNMHYDITMGDYLRAYGVTPKPWENRTPLRNDPRAISNKPR